MNDIKYKVFSLAIGLLCITYSLQAQNKYWVYLKDKVVESYDYQQHLSPAAIQKRQLMGIPLEQYTDIPLNPNYLQQLDLRRIKPIVCSKWLNAVSAELTQEQIEWLQKQRFVLQITAIKQTASVLYQPKKGLQAADIDYDLAISQMEPQAFDAVKLNAEGITIGVIDAGFFGAQRNENLQHIFLDGRILGVKDWVNPNKTQHFEKAETFSDWHGTRVMEMIAGYNEEEKAQVGFAHQASFYLARTDDGNHEFRGEEDYWVGAMEWMDSLGVRIINTSLGYALGFDNPEENHKPSEMNGKTTPISKAAQIAVDEKGLLLIVSAGNEGNNSWKIVSAPADAQGVVSVGATNKLGVKAGYSSIGPIGLPYLKPDVSCFSNDGTSFSAPVMTGFAACLMQLNPKATNKAIVAALHQSAPLYPYGNNHIGYGIPQASKAINLLNQQQNSVNIMEKKAIGKKKIALKGLTQDKNQVIIFHKKDRYEVLKSQVSKYAKGKLVLRRAKDTARTTVLLSDNTGFEVVWEE